MCNAIRSSNARILTSFKSSPNIVIAGGTGGIGILHESILLSFRIYNT